MIKTIQKKGKGKNMRTTYVKPKSQIDVLRKTPARRRPENNLRNLKQWQKLEKETLLSTEIQERHQSNGLTKEKPLWKQNNSFYRGLFTSIF